MHIIRAVLHNCIGSRVPLATFGSSSGYFDKSVIWLALRLSLCQSQAAHLNGGGTWKDAAGRYMLRVLLERRKVVHLGQITSKRSEGRRRLEKSGVLFLNAGLFEKESGMSMCQFINPGNHAAMGS